MSVICEKCGSERGIFHKCPKKIEAKQETVKTTSETPIEVQNEHIISKKDELSAIKDKIRGSVKETEKKQDEHIAEIMAVLNELVDQQNKIIEDLLKVHERIENIESFARNIRFETGA